MTAPPRPEVVELAPAPEPLEACRRLLALPWCLFLDSAPGSEGPRRYSFLTADPPAVVQSRRGITEVFHPRSNGWQRKGGDPLDLARGFLQDQVEQVAGLPPFQGGAAGYLGYEFGSFLEPVPVAPIDDLGMPDVLLGIYDWVIAWDHQASRCWLISTGLPETGAAREERAADRAREVQGWLEGPADLVALPPATGPVAPEGHFPLPGAAPRHSLDELDGTAPGTGSTLSPEEYRSMVSRVRNYILAGDIFQANVSQRFDRSYRGDPWDLYCQLRTANPAPFGAYLATGPSRIISLSPERFLRYDPETAVVETCPIKGTRPRSLDRQTDEQLAAELLASAKDRAENVMIVDLLRNDLSRVCRPGSVSVDRLCELERHPTVHHLVSTITGKLEPNADALDLIRAAFPGGSITGAPKVRAMEIIAELEPVRRQVYCGSIGYLSATGAMDISIAIRTAVWSGGRLYWWAGGGITAGSDPQEEYQESLAKAVAFGRAPEAAR